MRSNRSDVGEVWMDTPDDTPAYHDAYDWEPVEVTIVNEDD